MFAALQEMERLASGGQSEHARGSCHAAKFFQKIIWYQLISSIPILI